MPELTPTSSDLSRKIIASLERLKGRARWSKRLAQLGDEHGSEAYRVFFHILVHLDFTARQAQSHWRKLLEVWEELDRKTGERLDLRVVVVHYFLTLQKKLNNPAVVEIKSLQQARDSVLVDELTRIYNYRYFQHRIEQELKRVRRYDSGMSLLMIDVDDFKGFNDRNGHLAGNAALRKIGGLLSKCVREVDVVCRYGGEEFAAILPNTLKRGALTAAEKIRCRIAKARFRGGGTQPEGRVTVSVGVATVPTDANEAEELIARADAALYRAKAFGKNRVEAYSDERREFVRFDVAMDGKLRVVDQTPLTLTTSNVSQSGILFRTNHRLELGVIVHLELRLPRGPETWSCTARVVRVEELAGGYEVGVKIVHVEGEDVYRFHSFLSALQKRGVVSGRTPGDS